MERGPRLQCDMPSRSRTVSEAFRTTLDLFETGLVLMRQNLRRANPDATEEAIEELLTAWLHERPGAEHGDGPGRVVDLDARRR
jgi:hypothetical protein